MTTSYSILVEKLDAFIRKYYKNQVLKGLLYILTAALGAYLIMVSLEYVAHFNTLVRSILFYAYACLNAFIGLRYIVLPLLKLNKLGNILSYEQAATIIGKHFTEVEDKLVNVLQLQHASTRSALLEAAIDQKIKDLKPIPFSAAVNFRENKKYLKFLLIPLFAFVSLLFTAPSVLKDGTERLVHHATYYEKKAPFDFILKTKKLEVLQQDDFNLDVELTGKEIPDHVAILIEGNEFRLEKKSKQLFNYEFKNLQHSTAFRLKGDDYVSKEYHLEVLPKPILLNFKIALHYPAYIHKSDEVISSVGDLTIPAGTKLDWSFTTLNTDQLKFKLGDSIVLLHDQGSNNYAYSFRALKDQPYVLSVSNKFVKAHDSIAYSLNVIQDSYPSIEVVSEKDSVRNKLLYFKGRIKDDYGFTRLTFNYRTILKGDSGEKNAEPVHVQLPVRRDVAEDGFFYTWDLSLLNVNLGDAIEYYFEVTDNDGIKGPKSTVSEKMIFKAPTLKEVEATTESNNSKVKEDLQATIKEAKSLQKELNELNRKVLEKRELSWEEKKKMEDLLNQQKLLQERVTHIQAENQINNEKEAEFKQLDDRIAEKQMELQELMKNVLTPEMQQKMEELKAMLNEMDKNKVKNELEKMKMNAKDVEKELDRALESFKRLEVEQKLQASIEQLDALKKEQEALALKSEDKKEDAKKLADEQNNLGKKFEDFKNEMRDLEKKNKELQQPNNLISTEKQSEEIKKNMEEAKEQLASNKKQKAAAAQKDASQKMDALSKKLKDNQKQMEQENQEEDARAMRQLLNNLLQLSFDQEDLINDLQNTSYNDPRYVKIAKKQKALQDNAAMIEDSLLALSKRQPKISSTVNREITAINMNMAGAIAALAERQSSEGASRQQFAMTSINNLALILNESLEKMQQEAQSQKPGSGSCNKPGGKGKKPSMAGLRKQQEQLNEQLEKMKEALEKGKKEGSGKQGEKGKSGQNGQSGQGGMSEQLAKLAAEQEYIRRSMQQAAEGLEKNGKMGAKPGGDAAEKMEKTETDLVNRSITPETIKRQQEILNRLLQYEKAEKEQGQDDKRESANPKNELIHQPNSFIEYNKLKEQQVELLKTVPPSLNEYYKAKVNDYFNTFELVK